MYMKKMFAILAVALLSSYPVSSADADEGPLHWTARHVREAVVDTGHTLSNVGHTAGRTIRHRTQPIRNALR